MSLIHEALKKVQAIEKTEPLHAYSEDVKGRAYFNLSAISARTILLILALFIIISLAWWAISEVSFLPQYQMFFKKPQPDLESTGQTQSKARLPDVKSSGSLNVAEPALSVGPEDNAQSALKAAKTKNIKGVELYKQGRFFLAKREFLSSIEIFPEYAEAYNNIGLTYKQMGDMQSAEDNYKKALKYRPDYPEAMNNYGILLEAQGNSNKAREYFKKAVLIAPDYPDPYLNMAVSLENGRKVDDAIRYYEGFLSHAGKASPQAQDTVLLKNIRERVLYLKTNNFNRGENR